MTTLGLAAFLALALACIFALPGRIVAHDRDPHAPSPLTQADTLQAKNDVRQTLLQGLGGLAVLSGAALGVWLTLRQVQVSQEGQITDRLTRAVDQLGSAAVDVRIGGIYALERIARDSAADRSAVIEILTAFVRNRSPWPPPDPESRETAKVPRMWLRAGDVQAAMVVLGRSGWWRGPVRMELGNVDLRRCYLANADLRDAYLADANLQLAYLEGANLQGARMRGALLDLAHLGLANLRSARLRGSSLRQADLHDADLRGANLSGANLERARLGNVCFQGADLNGAVLRDARSDRQATWPDGFDPVMKGVTMSVDRLGHEDA